MQSAHHRNDAILSGFFADFFRFTFRFNKHQKLIINFNSPDKNTFYKWQIEKKKFGSNYSTCYVKQK
ncbi:hypothetical protein BpHYR1_019687 [Brachionus plicatilis]|uniref:Uncharacterized protein n=1 Tax=Brachionus plicatilis TaxID=10195 RepID=A0A3M7Q1V2_BRAPC|nr:hypothetical protein BpHYR1_019687 [Brachionus plicatilis]